MVKISLKIPFLFMLIISMISCEVDNPEKKLLENIMWGKIVLSVDVNMQIEEAVNSLKAEVLTDDFRVEIYNSAGEEVKAFEKVSELPESIELEEGSYFIVAHSNNESPAAFENPFYYGQSELFELKADETKSVNVSCTLANCLVSVIYSQSIINSFSNYYTVVGTTTDSLVYLKDEIRSGYFGLQSLSVKTYLVYTDNEGIEQTKILTGTIEAPVGAKHYEIHVDAGLSSQEIAVTINVDETTETDIITLDDSSNSEPLPGDIGPGELLITEIMYDPSALSDTEGEYIEIYNNSDHSIDLFQLVIKRDDVNTHIIDENLVLNAGEYIVLGRSATSFSEADYSYGSDITLSNSGATLILSNYGTDGTDGTAIFTIDYGSAGFPDPSGASLQLDQGVTDYTITSSSENWCASVTPFSTGDLGTPGEQNDSCLP